MNVFCTSCGKQGNPEQKVCIHCGTPFKKTENAKEQVVKTEVPVTPAVQKPPMPKKQKIIIGAIAGALLVIISFSMWANNYQSVEAVEKRYTSAIAEKDAKKLVGVILHDDGSKISQGEAEAHIKYANDYGEFILQRMYKVKEEGKFLFFFKAHKVFMTDQYGLYNVPFEGLSFKFNGESLDETNNGDEVLYGPVIPGVYTVTAEFSNDQGELSVEEEIVLDEGRNYLSMDIPLTYVTAYLDIGMYEPSVMSAHLLYNGEKVPFEENRETDEFGPVITDGTGKAQLVLEMPWGDVKSDEITIDGSYISAHADYLTDGNIDDILEVLTIFGDEYVQGLANMSNKDMTVFTDEYMAESEDGYVNDKYFSGEFIDALVDLSSLSVKLNNEDELTVKVNSIYTIEGDRYHLDDKPSIEEDEYYREFELVYDDGWLINEIYTGSFFWGYSINEEESKEIKGTGSFFEPTKEAIKDASDAAFAKDLKTFLDDYYYYYRSALKSGNYNSLSRYVLESSEADKALESEVEASDDGSEINEINISDLTFEETAGDTWTVTYTKEVVTYSDDEPETDVFERVVEIKDVDDKFKVSKLIEKKEVE